MFVYCVWRLHMSEPTADKRIEAARVARRFPVIFDRVATGDRRQAFYNRLARPGFANFMHRMSTRLVDRLSVETLAPEGHAAVARFKDIVIQDGSSFALKEKLRDVFPGRFTTIEPAAVEVHATCCGFSDEVAAVAIAPDKEAERQFLPDQGDSGPVWSSSGTGPSDHL